ncbi:hypothetical protein VOLCADRAFT_32970, partial [Volvox carteri f. nagariensis]
VRAVACGGNHTLAITSSGVFAWGCNAVGQCGLGYSTAPPGGFVVQPVAVPALINVPVSQVAAGSSHSLALTSACEVLSWGEGTWGQLGLGDHKMRHEPTPVEALWALPVVQIAAGHTHSAVVTSSGHAFVWGCNSYGQLGLLPE